MVNAEDLVLVPVGFEGLLQFSRACQVFPEWLLNLYHHVSAVLSVRNSTTYDNSGNAVSGIAVLLEMLRHRNENARWKSHVEDSVLLLSSFF